MLYPSESRMPTLTYDESDIDSVHRTSRVRPQLGDTQFGRCADGPGRRVHRRGCNGRYCCRIGPDWPSERWHIGSPRSVSSKSARYWACLRFLRRK